MLSKVKQWIFHVVFLALICFLSVFLLGNDAFSYWAFALVLLLLGTALMSLTEELFRTFEDRGFIFSQALALAVCGFLTWLLSATGIMQFTRGTCIFVCVLVSGLCIFAWTRKKRTGRVLLKTGRVKLMLGEEILFLAFFLLWAYLAGFRPQAYGTEKFMDYGFMEAMMRSTVLPAKDIWYSEGTINYYYGGQYFAVFLTKLTGTRVEVTYNLMRALIGGYAFVLPFSLASQMMRDVLWKKKHSRNTLFPVLTGLVSGTAVSLAGNMHYVIYGCIIPIVSRLRGEEIKNYWFPDATRYIGHNPDVPDKTIHEFPCYSFILGDLHAHVVNIIFVLLLLGILYAFTGSMRKRETPVRKGKEWLLELLSPHVIAAGLLLGLFKLNNYWDFVIYFVVTGGVVLFTNFVRFKGKASDVFLSTLLHAVDMIVLSWAAALPFTLKFDSMVSEVALCQNHSRFYQLLVLWGLPGLLTILLILSVFLEKRPQTAAAGLSGKLESLSIPDLFAVVAGLCALGLLLIPELVYVRDIYENGNARANTMFKLTYQAYILFGILIGYGIFRLLLVSASILLKICAGVIFVFWTWTVGYFPHSVNAWYGQVQNRSLYQGLDATAFLQYEFPEDAGAIQYLKDNVKDVCVVLEANGDSYTGYDRVSAMTGLPTVLGWYVHEWLWRSDTAILNEKSADVETIYTSGDEDVIRKLTAEYDISYIFVGGKEKEKYGDRLREDVLRRIGTVVYEDSASGTCIIRMMS